MCLAGGTLLLLTQQHVFEMWNLRVCPPQLIRRIENAEGGKDTNRRNPPGRQDCLVWDGMDSVLVCKKTCVERLQIVLED